MKKLGLPLLIILVSVKAFCQDAEVIANRYAKMSIDKLFTMSYNKGEVSKRESDVSVIVEDAFLKSTGRLEINVKIVWTGGLFNYRYNLSGNLYMDLNGCNTKWKPKSWNGIMMAPTKVTSQELGCVDSEEE